MGVITGEGTAAVAVGTDLLSGNAEQMVPYWRWINAYAYVGSNAIGTGKVDLYVGPVRVMKDGEVTTAAQAVDRNKDVIPLGRVPVPPGTMIHGYVSEVGAANPTILKVYTTP